MAETFKFPDEQDDVKVTTEDDQTDEQIIIDVEDNTPAEDRNKPPMEEKVKEDLHYHQETCRYYASPPPTSTRVTKLSASD